VLLAPLTFLALPSPSPPSHGAGGADGLEVHTRGGGLGLVSWLPWDLGA
jgi:hypothetical protein